MSETLEPVEVAAPAAPAPVAEADTPRDLRSVLSAAFDEVAGAAEPEAAAEAPQRDERGRFASTNAEEAPAEQEKPDGQEAAPEAGTALPAEQHPLERLAKEYEPYYASAGLNPEQATRMLFQAHKAILQDPAAGIRNLATQYNVDLRQFAQPAQRPQPMQAPTAAPQPGDPALASVQRELAELKQFLSSQQQQAQANEQAQVEQSISQFAADPKHSHFPTVRTAMGALMQAGLAKDMSAAYEMACRAHPDVWKAIQTADADAKAKADAAERAKAAAGARAKAVSVRGAVPMPGATAKPMDRRSQLEAAWDGRLN